MQGLRIPVLRFCKKSLTRYVEWIGKKNRRGTGRDK